MNVLKSNLLLNFCTKNHLAVVDQYVGWWKHHNQMINNDIFLSVFCGNRE